MQNLQSRIYIKAYNHKGKEKQFHKYRQTIQTGNWQKKKPKWSLNIWKWSEKCQQQDAISHLSCWQKLKSETLRVSKDVGDRNSHMLLVRISISTAILESNLEISSKVDDIQTLWARVQGHSWTPTGFIQLETGQRWEGGERRTLGIYSPSYTQYCGNAGSVQEALS